MTNPSKYARRTALSSTLPLLPLLALPVVLAGCHSSSSAPTTDESPSDGAHLVMVNGVAAVQLDPTGADLAHITTKQLGLEAVHQSVNPSGQVAATDNLAAVLTSRLPGRIASVLFSVGSVVKQGQLLATVDSIDLTQAESTYETAESHQVLMSHQLDQQKQLAGYGSLSEQPLEDATRAFQASQAAVASDVAQVTLDQVTLDNTRALVQVGETNNKPVGDAENAYSAAQSAQSAAQAAVNSDKAQLELDRVTLANTKQLVQMGEVTHKPLEDAQTAYAAALSNLNQAKINENSTKASLDRTQVLYDGGIYSKQQLEDATTAYNNAVANREQAVTQEDAANQELDRQKSIYQQNLNGTSTLEPVQAKLEQDTHTQENDTVTLDSTTRQLLQAKSELDRQTNIFQKKLNESSAIQPALSKLQQDQHTYESDLVTLEATRKEYQRAQLVHTSGIPVNQALQSAQDAYDEAAAAVQSATTTLRLYGVTPAQATAQLASGHALLPILAPLSGVVVERDMVVGQLTDTSTTLARVLDLSRVYVDAQIYESDLSRVHAGDAISVSVPAFPDRVFTGTVQYVGNEVSSDTRTLTVRTVIPNPGWLLRPGMFATVNITNRAEAPRIVVPADAVLQDGDLQVVYVQVAPQEFLKRTVTVQPADSGNVVVESGLESGDRVVTSGSVLLLQEQETLEQDKGAA